MSAFSFPSFSMPGFGQNQQQSAGQGGPLGFLNAQPRPNLPPGARRLPNGMIQLPTTAPRTQVGGSLTPIPGTESMITMEEAMRRFGSIGGGSLLGQAGLALERDIGNLSAAEQARAGAAGQQLAGLTGFVEGIAPGFAEASAAARGRLGEVGEQLTGRFGEFAGGILDEVRRRQDAAEATQREAISGFQDRVAADAVAASVGIRRSAQTQMQMIQGGIGPDGNPLTPQQQQEAMFQVRNQVNQEVFQTITPMMSRANEAVAGLRQSLASLQAGGAGTIGQVGAALGGQMAQLQAVAANLRSVGEQITAASQVQAVQYEMQGRLAMAELAQQAVPNPISIFSGITALMAAASAPGAARIPALQFGGSA